MRQTLPERALIQLRFDPDMSAELRLAAVLSRRSVTSLIREFVEQGMAQRRATLPKTRTERVPVETAS